MNIKSAKFIIEPYLTEANLGQLLAEIFDENHVHPQYSFLKKNNLSDVMVQNKIIVDYYVDHPTLPQPLVVEYNGPRHYTSFKQIHRDYQLRSICEKLNYRAVELPYFVQLNNDSYPEYFGSDVCNLFPIDIECEWVSGFISKKIIMPYDFCLEGQFRFLEDTTSNSKVITPTVDKGIEWCKTRDAVIRSMHNRQDHLVNRYLFSLTKVGMPSIKMI